MLLELSKLLMNLTEEENLTGVVLLTDASFARYLFVAVYYLNKFYNSGNCKTVYEIQQIKESPEYH